MSFEDWLQHGWIRRHQTSAQEIAELFKVVKRDLRASAATEDPDWRFAIAYNAALQSAAAALKAAGYDVPKGGGAHHRTIESLRLTIGDDGTITEALQHYRSKRGGGVYETTGIASDQEVREIQELAAQLFDRVAAWIKKTHPALMRSAERDS